MVIVKDKYSQVLYFIIFFIVETVQLLKGKRPQVEVAGDLLYLREKGVTADVPHNLFLAQREHLRRQKYTCLEVDSSKSVISSIVAGLFHDRLKSGTQIG